MGKVVDEEELLEGAIDPEEVDTEEHRRRDLYRRQRDRDGTDLPEESEEQSSSTRGSHQLFVAATQYYVPEHV